MTRDPRLEMVEWQVLPDRVREGLFGNVWFRWWEIVVLACGEVNKPNCQISECWIAGLQDHMFFNLL